MLEAKAANMMEDPEVLAKKSVAVAWCGYASDHAATCGGKPWAYVLIPDNAIAANMTIDSLAKRFGAAA